MPKGNVSKANMHNGKHTQPTHVGADVGYNVDKVTQT